MGIFCQGADNSRRGYNIVKRFLKQDILRIHPQCRTLIKQLKDLQYSDTVNDDCTDVLRYVCVRIHDLMFRWRDVPEGKPEAPFKHRAFNFNDPLLFPKSMNDQKSMIRREAEAY